MTYNWGPYTYTIHRDSPSTARINRDNWSVMQPFKMYVKFVNGLRVFPCFNNTPLPAPATLITWAIQLAVITVYNCCDTSLPVSVYLHFGLQQSPGTRTLELPLQSPERTAAIQNLRLAVPSLQTYKLLFILDKSGVCTQLYVHTNISFWISLYEMWWSLMG